MEYLEQVEKLYKYLEFNLEIELMHSMIDLKHRFNNDLNLIGCFLKDYLIVKTNKKLPNDADLYDEFILYFEDETKAFPSEFVINELVKYSRYYLSIVFEDFTDENILIAVSTINSCFALEYYPVIMKILNKYYQGGFTFQKFKMLLESVVDVAIKNFEESDILDMQPVEIEDQVKRTAVMKSRVLERALT